MLQYFTNASRGGWVIHGSSLAIAVLEAPDKHLPVGIATEVGKNAKVSPCIRVAVRPRD